MTENESVLITLQNAIDCATDDITREDLEMMVKCLEELQQYRAIGTVEEIKANKIIADERYDYLMDDIGLLKQYASIGTIEEFKALKEKSVAKKVIGIESGLQSLHCPSCSDWSGFEIKKGMKFCPNCGQALET